MSSSNLTEPEQYENKVSHDDYIPVAHGIIESNYDGVVKSFDAMNLREDLLRGQDVIAQAQSGTGKTVTFSIAILEKLDLSNNNTQGAGPAALTAIDQHWDHTGVQDLEFYACAEDVAFPNIQKVVLALGDYLGSQCYACIGDRLVCEDMSTLNSGAHVVVGTPGHVHDMIKHRALDTKDIRVVVLDEADEISRGFKDQIYDVFQFMPSEIQVLSQCMSRTTVTPKRFQSARQQKEQFNIGVIGIGRIGRMHLRNVLQNRKLSVQWVVDDNVNVWPDVRGEFLLHKTPFLTSDKLPLLLTESSLDAVMVLSSTSSHTQLSCQVLQHDKAVFVEKPAGETIDDIRRCFLMAEKHNKPFLVGFNRRFDPTMAEAHRLVTNGSIGKLQYLRFTTRDSPKPSYDFLKTCDATGCNILSDLCVHDVDQLVWLTQCQRPQHVYVTTHAHDALMAQYGEADALGMLIKYKNGVMACFDAFRESVYGYDIRMEIFGSHGMVTAGNPRETSTSLDNVNGRQSGRIHLSFPQRFATSFQTELDHFVQCLEGRTSPLITKEENLLVAEIIDRGLESFRTRKPVYFDE